MSRYGILLFILAIIEVTSTTSVTDKPKPYEIVNVNTSCTSEELRIRVHLNRNFRGAIYTKGFPLEKNCRSLGNNENFVEISISTSGCGVRLVPLTEDTLSYSVALNVQIDKFLQQINDIELSATCKLTPNDMVHTKHAALNKHISRTGRYQTNPEAIRDDNVLKSIRSWMEIEGTAAEGKEGVNRVAVGEQTMLLVKSIIPDDMTANVVDCYAHDGTREATQRLLDENGCPLDESIMPSLETIKYEGEDENEIHWEDGQETTPVDRNVNKGKWEPPKMRRTNLKKVEREGRKTNVELIPEFTTEESKMKMQIIGTMFSAFKFPDTSNLHLKCVLQICRPFCPPVNCGSNDEREGQHHNRTSKALKTRDYSSVLDRIEVFNSVEVVAPGIDNDGYVSPEDMDEYKPPSGEKIFCLSASKMAFSFAILGAVFLCGVLAALWTIIRNQMRTTKSYDGSEQILVVRDSPLNLVHPRCKPYTNWSYT